MPMISKKAQERLDKQKALLESRRSPIKGKVQKFRPRIMEYEILIMTEVLEDGTDKARDIPYRIEAKDSLRAVLEALSDLENKLNPGEVLHNIHIGPGKWLQREGIGKR